MADKKLNVYQKLALARYELKGMNKGGTTTMPNGRTMNYFELSDIVPRINELGVELGFVTAIRITADDVTLDFIDSDELDALAPRMITFTSPMSTADMRGCQPVQSLGAVHTYMRRYMYMLAFDIVEADQLEPMTGRVEEPPKPEEWVAIAKRLQQLAQDRYAGEASGKYKQMLEFLDIKSSKELKPDMVPAATAYLTEGALPEDIA